jgi:competence protein ComGC
MVASIMKPYFFAIFLSINMIGYAGSITTSDLTAEYNNAFYANNFILAEKWLDILIIKDPENLDYWREKAKMLALNGNTTEFLATMLLIRNKNTPQALEAFFQVVDFPKLSSQDTKAIKDVFVNDKLVISRWDSKPRNFQLQDFNSNFSGVQVPDFRKKRDEARKKACYANMRILLGAVEMYNMDHTDMMTSIDSNKIKLLLAKGYLKTDISLPSPQCKYYATGDLSADGLVACSFHGSIPVSD